MRWFFSFSFGKDPEEPQQQPQRPTFEDEPPGGEILEDENGQRYMKFTLDEKTSLLIRLTELGFDEAWVYDEQQAALDAADESEEEE